MSPILFPTEALRPLLESYAPPSLPDGNPDTRSYRFDLLSLTRMVKNIGRFEMQVTDLPSGRQLLFSLHRPSEGRYGSPEGYVYRSEYDYLTDASGLYLEQWRARCWNALEQSPEQAVAYTDFSAAGERTLRGYRIQTGTRTKEHPTGKPIAAKWPLLDYLRRLADENTDTGSAPPVFDCLDEYGIIMEDHRITPGEPVTLPGGFETTAFLHTGRAQIPRFVYADTSGRPLLYLSGTEGAILTGIDDSKGSYSKINYDLKTLRLPKDFIPEQPS